MIRLLSLFAILTLALPVFAVDPPNIVLIYCDDLGYGDLGCFGSKTIATPHLDQLAKEGRKFTDFYVSQPVCSASRASLLTGCYANRVGINGALSPQAKHGLNPEETTLAELCKSKGYATGMVGKWHLGHRPEFLPTKHGFDTYLGLPYSNDMWPNHPSAQKGTYPPLPLIENDQPIQTNLTAEDQAKLTEQYTDRAVKFIGEQAGKKPFFLYVAHSMPHVPIYAGAKFVGKSKAGTYGDVIEEIDASVGRILAALAERKVEKNTLVIFTSDNGPWLSYGNHSGTAGPLREGKGSVWEGGIRVPFLARWPGVIPAGTVQNEPAMTIDLLPTIAKWIGAELPKLKIDGKDSGSLFTGGAEAKSPQEAYFFYYGSDELQAMRSGKWKLIFPHSCRMIEERTAGKDGKPAGYRQVPLPLMLYDLEADIGEKTNLADKNPDVVKRLQVLADGMRNDLGDKLTKDKPGPGKRLAGQAKQE